MSWPLVLLDEEEEDELVMAGFSVSTLTLT